jgi:hypothetical protein
LGNDGRQESSERSDGDVGLIGREGGKFLEIGQS